MATLAVGPNKQLANTVHSPPMWHSVKSWLLMLPLVFLAGGGQFSFQMAGGAGGSLAGLNASQNTGFIDRFVLPGLAYAIIFWLIFANIRGVFKLAWQMKLFSGLALLTVASALWSQDPSRSFTYGCFYLVDTLFAMALATRFTTEELMSIIRMAGACAAIAGLAVVLLLPQAGISHDVRGFGAWLGIFPDRTTAAKLMVFFMTPALVFEPRTFTRSRWLYIALIGVMLLAARSVTSIVVLIAYAVIMALLYAVRFLERRVALVMAASIPIVGGLVVALLLANLESLLRFSGRDLTLTGRTHIWSALIPSIAKHPLLGYGFYAFWLGMRGESANLIIALHWVFGYAHNGFLEVAVQLGLLGVIVVSLTLIQAMRHGLASMRENSTTVETRWCLGFIIITIFYNIDEATFLFPHALVSILYIVVCCKLSQIYRRVQPPSQRMLAEGAG